MRAQRRRGLVVPIWVPGAAGRAMTSGDLLPQELGRVGHQSFTEWLVEQQRHRDARR
jgi:hypothetical protein